MPRSLRLARHLALAGAVATVATVAACSPPPPSSAEVAQAPVASSAPAPGYVFTQPLGVDVSNYQHPYGAAINWSTVRANGRSFAFVKVSEGTSYTNPYYQSDLAAAGAAGLARGGYHFARPSASMADAADQARRFVQLLGNVNGANTIQPVLDLEVTGGQPGSVVTQWTATFLSTVQQLTGRVPILYTGGWFWNGYLGGPTSLSNYPLWVAYYSSSAPPMFGGWSNAAFWQYSGSGTVPGISGEVDLNKFTGGGPATYAGYTNNLGVTATLSTAVAPRNSPVTLTARVTPASSGVVVHRQRLDNGVWHDVGTATTTSNGTILFPFTWTQPGTVQYRFLVTLGANTVVSNTVVLTVT